LLDTTEACCLSLGFTSHQIILLRATAQSQPPIIDSDSSDSDLSQLSEGLPTVPMAVPIISVSSPTPELRQPTGKPGDLLKDQLRQSGAKPPAGPSLTFADRVMASQKGVRLKRHSMDSCIQALERK